MDSPPVNPLRESKWIWSKSAYAIEVDPWIPREDIEAALLFRGTIVGAYGYVETRLGEIAIRSSRLDAYSELRAQFPYRLDRRIHYLREIFRSGPLAPFQAAAHKFLDRFEASAELRHIMAHAQMEMGPREWGITFYDFPGASGGAVTYRRKRYTLTDLEAEAWRASRFSRLGQTLYWRLNETKLLPPFDWA